MVNLDFNCRLDWKTKVPRERGRLDCAEARFLYADSKNIQSDKTVVKSSIRMRSLPFVTIHEGKKLSKQSELCDDG